MFDLSQRIDGTVQLGGNTGRVKRRSILWALQHAMQSIRYDSIHTVVSGARHVSSTIGAHGSLFRESPYSLSTWLSFASHFAYPFCCAVLCSVFACFKGHRRLSIPFVSRFDSNRTIAHDTEKKQAKRNHSSYDLFRAPCFRLLGGSASLTERLRNIARGGSI